LDQLSVLVVEDEAIILGLLREVLGEGGFAVGLAGDAEEAIAALEDAEANYRALVTDVRLIRGGATGWDVARRARELDPTMPVVYITGDGAADWASQGVPKSVLVTKPFAPSQVLTAVSQLLNGGDAPDPSRRQP
jgi:DNA-binding NtrC family response regulator